MLYLWPCDLVAQSEFEITKFQHLMCSLCSLPTMDSLTSSLKKGKLWVDYEILWVYVKDLHQRYTHVPPFCIGIVSTHDAHCVLVRRCEANALYLRKMVAQLRPLPLGQLWWNHWWNHWSCWWSCWFWWFWWSLIHWWLVFVECEIDPPTKQQTIAGPTYSSGRLFTWSDFP